MSPVAVVKAPGQSETVGLAASLFIFLSWSLLVLLPLVWRRACTGTHIHTIYFFSSLHYKEDGEDHL